MFSPRSYLCRNRAEQSTHMSAPAIPLSFKSNITPIFPNGIRYNYYNRICFACSPTNSSITNCSRSGGEKPLHYSYDSQEEARWLREEQRWLREEQRWLREESRWNKEKEALLREIHRLKSQKHEAESTNIVPENNVPKVLQLLKENGSSARPIVLKTTTKEEEVEEDIIEVSQQIENKVKKKKRSTLRIGSEGEEVKSMQEALEKLGFYSGDEDMEFSSFSSGTERAVKIWQSTLGAPEDGIMTTELLDLLYDEKLDSHSFTAPKKDNVAATGTKTQVKIDYRDEQHRRVYLIGENRWEDPSKLSSRKNSSQGNGQASLSPACMSCRGEGRVLCMECEGTGEPNIEPQFVEWIGEGAQCAYCDGLGYVTCDVCI